jgi:hypothetical protein
MVGTLIEAVFTSSTYMALMSFRALAQYSAEEQIKAMVTLTLLVGLLCWPYPLL